MELLIFLCRGERFQYVNGRKRDFAFHGGRWHDCKEFRDSNGFFPFPCEKTHFSVAGCVQECRWLETECKKLCFDRPDAGLSTHLG